MATKSFLKTIDIREKRLANAFAAALQKTEIIQPKEVKYTSTPTEIKGADAVKNFFNSAK